MQRVTEAAAMPISQLCHMREEVASMQCGRCGPLSFFCVDYFRSCQEYDNIFHVGEKWEV